MRSRAALWRAGVVVVWLGGLVALALADSGTAVPYVLGGVPLTIATGALVDRYWVLFVPSIVEILGLLAFLVGDLVSHSCTNCGDAGGWGFLLIVGAMTFTIPATAALLVGVAARHGFGAMAGRLESRTTARPTP